MKSLIIPTVFILISCTVKEKESKQVTFEKQMIYDQFVSEGVATGDVNQDGLMDILSGPFWFEAPDWQRHEIREPQTFDPSQGWSDSFLNFTTDVNQDGWVDLIRIDFPGRGAYWYENPKNASGYWQEFLIDSTACNESPMMADVNDDGRFDLVFGSGKREMKWFVTQEGQEQAWSSMAISKEDAPGTHRFSHGLGHGDINKDGRKDIIVVEGWWEAPMGYQDFPWTFHEAPLGEPASQMHVYDFDQDGDNDVISSSAHNYGIWWHEHIKDENGGITFQRHLIDSSYSQTHGIALSDMNGDGLPDLITGKRYYAHNGKDPGGNEPAVIYWYELSHDEENNPIWTRHLIDDNSGVGLQVEIIDLDSDGNKDIVIANKKGIFIFKALVADS